MNTFNPVFRLVRFMRFWNWSLGLWSEPSAWQTPTHFSNNLTFVILKFLDNGGLVKVNAIVSPVDIKSSQFKAMTSNSIRSVVKSVLDGNVALDHNSPCFAIESISNQKPCPGNNEIKFEKSQIRASSFLETFTENYDDGNVCDFYIFVPSWPLHRDHLTFS